MAEYEAMFAQMALGSTFVDEALFAENLGATKPAIEAVELYLKLPIAARPDLSYFFDSRFYRKLYPDIEEARIDPLIHFLQFGIIEERLPHPLVDPKFIRSANEQWSRSPLSAENLFYILSNDLADPSRFFSLDYYRAQLTEGAKPQGGLLRNFMREGITRRLKPNSFFDPVAYYAQLRDKPFDIRSTLHDMVLRGADTIAASDDASGEVLEETLGTKTGYLAQLHAKRPICFACAAEPDITVIMAVRDEFPRTLAALAALRTNYAGNIELIVVDCGSADETKLIGRYVQGVKVIRFEHDIAFARACNAASDSATAAAILYLDSRLEPAPGAVSAALHRLRTSTRIAAVGAKMIDRQGRLVEAGCIIGSDGSLAQYLRGRSPMAPEANFLREVDFCSAGFLLIRASLLTELGGLDVAFAASDYVAADLCIRIAQRGGFIAYDPVVAMHGLNVASIPDPQETEAERAQQRDALLSKHAEYFRLRPRTNAPIEIAGRTTGAVTKRVLVVSQYLPVRMLGSPYTRLNDVVEVLASVGCEVTLYPLIASTLEIAHIYRDFPETVEVMHDRTLEQLALFLHDRRQHYDAIWIAGAATLDLIKPILEGDPESVGSAHLILDAGAIAALRDAARAALFDSHPFDLSSAVRHEFGNASLCQTIVALSEADAQQLRALGLERISLIGHMRPSMPTPRSWSERRGLLFVGACQTEDSTDCGALSWFVDDILPHVEQELGWKTRLTVVGQDGDGVALDRFIDHRRITLAGVVADVAPLYEAHRVLVAPTRYAAGLPYELHEAAAHGIPAVTTELLRGELGWENGRDILSSDISDPLSFARHIVSLYRSEEHWLRIRDGAAKRVRTENTREAYAAALQSVLDDGVPRLSNISDCATIAAV
jgi:O-antigen biosynthesis protein